MLSTTVCASNAEPSEQVTSSRSSKLTASAVTFHDEASCGWMVPRGSTPTRVSYAKLPISVATNEACGSRFPGSASVARVNVFPST